MRKSVAPPEPKLHVVAGILINDHKHILFQYSKHKVTGENLLIFPGGKVEANETSFQAIVRELQEELGIKVQTAKRIYRCKCIYNNLIYGLDIWYVGLYSEVITNCENQMLCWLDIANYSNLHKGDYEFLPITRIVLQDLEQRLALPVFYTGLKYISTC